MTPSPALFPLELPLSEVPSFPAPFVYPKIDSPADLNYSLLDLSPRLYGFNIEELDVLNLGAGNGEGIFSANLQSIQFHTIVNVEIFEDALFNLSHYHFAAKNVDFINAEMCGYVRTLKDKSFDIAVLIDAIEHVTTEQAWALIKELKRVCRKRIIMFLPLGEALQGEYGGNAWQEHKSTWSPEDFELPNAEVEVMWKHFHVEGNPFAGYVTFFLD